MNFFNAYFAMRHTFVFFLLCLVWGLSLQAQNLTDLPKDTVRISLDSLDKIPFVADDSVGCVPFRTKFANEFNQPDATYKWSFGDGEGSSERQPVHTYLKSGIYDVRLVVYLKKDSLVYEKRDYIKAFGPPIPAFQTEQTCWCKTPAEVEFTNLSPTAGSYRWYFEGGDPAVFEGFSPPMVSYKRAGNFTVKLFAESPGGCSDSLVLEQYMQISEGVRFGASGTSASCAPYLANFVDHTAGCVEAWAWDFGDGGKSIFKDPVHLYKQPGSYDVSLKVKFQNGCADSLRQQNFIQISGANLTYNLYNPKICQGEAIDMQLKLVGYALIEPEKGVLKVVSSKNPEEVVDFAYTFSQTGNYLMSLTYVDTSGCIAKIPILDTISVYPAAKANFTAEPNFGPAPLETRLFVQENSNNILSKTEWTLSNGAGSSYESKEKSPQFLLKESGRYGVRLFAENQWGCSDTTVKAAYISVGKGETPEPEYPQATFTPVADDPHTLNIQIVHDRVGEFMLTVLDATQNKVMTESYAHPGGTKTYKFSTLSLPDGDYLLLLNDKSGSWEKTTAIKVVK